jgi:aryl-alcohol dehydrogenase-like predicted oxidoreductase
MTQFQQRRRLLKAMLAMGGATLLPWRPVLADDKADAPITRSIPASGEKLFVSGMGSARTFDINPDDKAAMATMRDVLKTFYDHGGRAIDTSPMYGNAETVLGILLKELGLTNKVWLATKVWTRGREEGIYEMERSLKRLGRDKLELIQVHNLVDTQVHLDTLRGWQKEGRVRYIGATHYLEDRHDDLIELIRKTPMDFLQFNYNLSERNAEKTLLPLCADKGVATLINEPFNKGRLFGMVKGRPLPEWAGEIDCHSWAQLFLKYLIGHPAVTAVIPATSDPEHARDNARAGYGRVPDDIWRRRILSAVDP